MHRFGPASLLFVAACLPASQTSVQGFRCAQDADCEGLACVRGICGGVSPVRSADAGRPDFTLTGPAPTTALVRSKAMTVATSQTIAQLDVDGVLVIAADGVTVRDSRVRGGVVVTPGVSGARLERVWVGPTAGIAVQGSPAAVVDCRLEADQGVVGAVDSQVEGNAFAPPAPGTGSFVDVQGGTRGLIAYNSCVSAGGSCVTGAPVTGALRDVLILGNWLEGSGPFAVDLARAAGTELANPRVLDNHVGRGFTGSGGPLRVAGPAVLEGNRYWPDGAPLP